MVGVAQLVEPLIVVQVVAGSSPVTHPTRSSLGGGDFSCLGIGLITMWWPSGGHSIDSPQDYLRTR